MPLLLEPLEPIVEATDVASDWLYPAGRHRVELSAHPIPFLLEQPALRIAFVRGVRKEQWHDVD